MEYNVENIPKIIRRSNPNRFDPIQKTTIPVPPPLPPQYVNGAYVPKLPLRPEGITDDAYTCVYDPTNITEYRKTSTGQVVRRKRVIAVPKNAHNTGNDKSQSSSSHKKSGGSSDTVSHNTTTPHNPSGYPQCRSEPALRRVKSQNNMSSVVLNENESSSEPPLLSWFEEEPVTNYQSPLLASKGVRINNLQTLGRFCVLVTLSFMIIVLSAFMVIYSVVNEGSGAAITIWTGLIGTVFGVWIPQPKIPRIKTKKITDITTELDSDGDETFVSDDHDLEIGI